MSKRDKSRRPNKAGIVSACVLVLLLLAAGVVVALKLRGRAPERIRADKLSALRIEGLSDSEKDRALRREQLEAAEKLLAEYPTNDDVVYLAGLVHEDQGNKEEAMKLWTRSIELDATRADANESMGQALLLRDDYAGAEKYFRRALELDSNSPSARLRLATALSQQGQLPEAVSVLEQGHGLSAEAYRLMAQTLQQLNQYERARTNYEGAIKLKSDFAE